MRPGYFISLEGVDGAGKSTQVAALAGALRTEGHDVHVVRPSDTVLGDLVRGYILQHQVKAPIEPWSEALMFFAQRAQLLRESIIPALDKGAVVISDRYTDSTLAYQGGGRGLDKELLRTLHRVVCHGINPDLTILMDLPLDAAVQRQRAQELPVDRIEQAPQAFHKRVAATFDELVAEEPDRWVRVNAAKGAAEISREILKVVVGRLAERPEHTINGAPAASKRVPVA